MGKVIMKTPKKQFGFSRSILALAVLAAFGSAHAEDDEVAQLTQPESSASVGLGGVTGDSKDRAIYGQYNGRRLDGSNLLLDVDYVKRDDALGLWTNFRGSNLGLDTQEMSFSQNKQGDWKYSVEYSELVRRDPRTINTGMVNPFSLAPTVVSLATPGSGTNLNLDIRRKAASLSAEKWITANLMFEGSVKSEDRIGERMSGTGVACMPAGFSSIPCSTLSGAILMLPENISSTTRQFEARLDYSGEKFLVSGGYYGSFFSNANGFMNPAISGNLYNPDGSILDLSTTPGSTLAGYLQQSVALPPDNQAQQLYVSGNYAFTQTTRATFKYSYTHATQTADFGSMGLTGAPAGVSNLGGVLDSTLVQLGVTARPMTKLSMLANLRYEDKADKTPLALYNGAYTNDLNSSKKLNGKLEASYKLPDNYRGTLGMDYETVHRNLPVSTAAVWNATLPPLSGLRDDTQELGYRAELQRSMSETINASVAYVQSRRTGGSWTGIGPVVNTGNPPTGTYPMTMEDRIRNKVRVSADWTPTNILSLQFMLENGKDTYTSPSNKGLRDTGMSTYGIDAALNMSENWKLTSYLNQGVQTLHVDHSVGYMAELEDVNTSFGLGAVGKVSSKLEVGGDLSLMDDTNHYKQSMATGAAIVGGGLPDVTYRMTKIKLYGKYAVQKNANIRVDLVQQSVQFDEWSWGNNGTQFTYSDNSSVSMQQNQSVTFLGASYIYKFK
jgi:MtrB/PioB family decaheme-associated outer membrane protein